MLSTLVGICACDNPVPPVVKTGAAFLDFAGGITAVVLGVLLLQNVQLPFLSSTHTWMLIIGGGAITGIIAYRFINSSPLLPVALSTATA